MVGAGIPVLGRVDELIEGNVVRWWGRNWCGQELTWRNWKCCRNGRMGRHGRRTSVWNSGGWKQRFG